MLSFDQAEFRYEPFPIGLAKEVLAPDHYLELVAAFPDIAHMKHLRGNIDKLSLSEKSNPLRYRSFVRSNPLWRDFHAYIKRRGFIGDILKMLRERHIDLKLERKPTTVAGAWVRVLGSLLRGQPPYDLTRLSARFEFSIVHGDGGYLKPHTDTKKKIITLVISMIGEGEWPLEYGGGTDVNRALDDSNAYNYANRSLEFSDVEILHTYAFEPNQCVIFVKTFNSLHSVRPIHAPADALRKSLTINIERAH